MSKGSNIVYEEGETKEQTMQLNEIYYNCTECPSSIEILSLNEKRGTIEFKCINNNHRKKILIKEYINKMKKYNNKNINKDICIDNNHNNYYEYFCLDCKKHLCKECLKTRYHIGHKKNLILEIQPSKKELNIIESIIKSYEDKIDNLEREKIIKSKEMNNKLKESKNKLKEKNELKMKENNNNMDKEIELKNEEYLLKIKNIKNKDKNSIKLIEYNYEKNINEIKNKYKIINNNNNKNFKNEIISLENKYRKKIQIYNYDENIENMIYIRRLYEVIYNTYNIYNNNYHNSININNILINIFNNKSNINKELNNQYENIIRIRKNKEKDDFQKAAKDKTNLDNILSFEICKKIFSCLTEKKKLEIIQYNNNMQNELDININNYKCFTGKYLKNENIVREYNHDDKLIFKWKKKWKGKRIL